ncbi:hypothetical protein [Gordonia sp. (in: high G+C Gram-positive bacteria)]|uniref:hypothetical protein n=1 Tax=Gordonia sp. (in: high G+C Gram-positive bacteria) TaxID=84139 RepID=UPI002605E483|nr:hypothetical protein [Gordonia sp. (in: high G+C Gram-positive bacteria)]
MRYHPWRDARARSTLDIVFVDGLPTGMRGRCRGDRIEIRSDALQVERRCTLAHELVHHERGGVPADPILLAREETHVEAIAARRLVTLDRLVDALTWTRHAAELADELWIDQIMLAAYIESLTPDERAWIDRELSRRAA